MASIAGEPVHTPRRKQAGVPGPLRLIARDTLQTALDQAASRKVTVVAAPAGSGKTSLLRAWAGRQDERRGLAVVQVQRDQQDAQLFWLAMLKAVRALSGEPVGAEPPKASPDFDGAAMVDRVLAELAGRRARVTVLIDDVHELGSAEAFTHLTRLLTNLPDGVHAILATRRDLPLRLHHLRLEGQLAELRAADLRFSEEETRVLLTAAGITLSDSAVTRLHERTEGWAAGLRLAVLSLTGHPDPERFVAEFTGSGRAVAEYLIAEMLEHQPEDVQNLLLRTSILQRVNGELADLLTGRPGSTRILLGLEDANAFVVSLDAQRTWFRYHHMFTDLLRLELRRSLPGEVQALHRTAAAWFTVHGAHVEAVRHLQAAGDWSEAAELLVDYSFGMMLDGQEETMQTLLEAFPGRTGVNFPELSAVRTMIDMVHGRLEEAAAHLAVTAAYAASAPEDRRPRLEAAVAALNLSMGRRRASLPEVMRHAVFLDQPPAGQTDEEIALGAELRVVALMNLGAMEAFALGVSDGPRHLREGAALARKIGRPYLEVACLSQLGFATKLPDFTAARIRSEEAIALAEEHGWGTAHILAPALISLACTMVWMGEFDDAEGVVHRVDLALRGDEGPGISTLAHLVKGMLHAGRFRLAEAADAFGRAAEFQSRLPEPHALGGYVIAWLLATRARLGAVQDARDALEALDSPLIDSGELRTARAVVCLAEGDPDAALAAVGPVNDRGAPVVHVATVVEANVLAALAHDELGAHKEAHEALECALALAEPQGLVLPFVMAGAGAVLEALPPHRTAHAALRADILDVAHGTSLTTPAPAPTAAPPELSPAEIRVLRYLPTNLSRPEIADELSISVNTVNTHVRNIYAKLQATDRTSAVRRARQLRLLATGNPR
ncbi:LuxR family maltose regulon positive regulatory protein [Catenulispora sp. GP43]|uniref:helix-turn-helix transcriptional regulator n=1 Tax=Catenulispora sp. GP43 TaxID=3156263 RepID=UPI0035124272